MVRTQISLTPAQMNGLRELARHRGTSMAQLLREAVDALLDEARDRQRLQRALESIGGFRSGLSDVAHEHDRYLAEDPLE